MRRKDMQPGVLYAIKRNGMPRPGYVFDASTPRIRTRAYWTWPGTLWPYDEPVDPERLETDYLNPTPDLLDPRSKYDDNLIVTTSDVIAEWETYALQERAERAARLQARLDQDAKEAADKAAEIASNTARVEALRPYLEGVQGYLGIDALLSDAKTDRWTPSYYSAKDVVTLLEQALAVLALEGKS
jgi:hypothetical protein